MKVKGTYLFHNLIYSGLICLISLSYFPKDSLSNTRSGGTAGQDNDLKQFISLAGWSVAQNGIIETQKENLLSVRYKSSAKKIILRPPKPIPLADNVYRLGAYFANNRGNVKVTFFIKDSKGKKLTIPLKTGKATPQESEAEKPSRDNHIRYWGEWYQLETPRLKFTLDLNKRVQKEYITKLDAARWVFPLKLTGIQVVPVKSHKKRKDKVASDHGEADSLLAKAGEANFFIAELRTIEADGFNAKHYWYLEDRFRRGINNQCYIFADDLVRFKKILHLRYDITFTKGYQGEVLWRGHGVISNYDSTDLVAIFENRITIPELPQGRYFVETKGFLPNGKLAQAHTMHYWVFNSTVKQSTVKKIPLRIESGQPNHVFAAGTKKAVLTVHAHEPIWKKARKNPVMKIKVYSFLGDLLLEQIRPPADVYKVNINKLLDGYDYTCIAEIVNKEDTNSVYNTTKLHFGVQNDLSAKNINGEKKLPSFSSYIKDIRTLPIAEHWNRGKGGRIFKSPPDIKPEGWEDFEAWYKETEGLGYNVLSFDVPMEKLQPLPGVYRFAILDEWLNRVRKAGKKVYLQLFAMEKVHWLDFTPYRDQYGYVLEQGRRGRVVNVSFWDQTAMSAHEKYLRTVASRYSNNDVVLGYTVRPFQFRAINDFDVMLRIDYSKPAQEKFVAWLNAQGRKPYAMQPPFTHHMFRKLDSGPDLSLEWQDFIKFRTYTYIESVKHFVNSLRDEDPSAHIQCYRGPLPNAWEAALPYLKGCGVLGEGGPGYLERFCESMAMQSGAHYLNENHVFTPASIGVVDAGFFYGSCKDDFWHFRYIWNHKRHTDKRFVNLHDTLAFVMKSEPAVRQFISATERPAPILVYGSRASQLYAGRKRGHYTDIDGVAIYLSLFQYHQLAPAAFADEYLDVDLSKYKLVIATGLVLDKRAEKKLLAYAKSGGKLLIIGEDTGIYSLAKPQERSWLFSQIGKLENVRTIDHLSTDPPAPGAAEKAPKTFSETELKEIMDWAGISREIYTENDGFEVLLRKKSDTEFYASMFRRFPGRYRNIWYDEDTMKKWGLDRAKVVVLLPSGTWNIEKIHRHTKQLGSIKTSKGMLRFQTDQAVVGEMQIFRLSKKE